MLLLKGWGIKKVFDINIIYVYPKQGWFDYRINNVTFNQMLYSRFFNTVTTSVFLYLKQVTRHIIVSLNINSIKLLKTEIEIL